MKTGVNAKTSGQPKHTVYVDLDGTLIWAWSPVIATAFMAKVFGALTDTPPTMVGGYRRLTKVPIGKSYALACSRPAIRPFLAALRRFGDVRMITHADRNYALAMNRAFALGFTRDRIFAVGDKMILKPQPTTILLDDESKGAFAGFDTFKRHSEKCRLLGIEVGSSWDIPVPPFSGFRNDPFSKPKFRRALVQRACLALAKPQTMPKPPKEDYLPPYTLADYEADDPQARIEGLCGLCLSTRETAKKLGVSRRTVLNRYHRDELLSFPALFGKNWRRFPLWQFIEAGGGVSTLLWVQPLVAAFGQNGWRLIEFLIAPRPPGLSYLSKLIDGGGVDVEEVIAAAKQSRAEMEKTSGIGHALRIPREP
jgi:hypothetical protein